jgi:hypothetical protein
MAPPKQYSTPSRKQLAVSSVTRTVQADLIETPGFLALLSSKNQELKHDERSPNDQFILGWTYDRKKAEKYQNELNAQLVPIKATLAGMYQNSRVRYLGYSIPYMAVLNSLSFKFQDRVGGGYYIRLVFDQAVAMQESFNLTAAQARKMFAAPPKPGKEHSLIGFRDAEADIWKFMEASKQKLKLRGDFSRTKLYHAACPGIEIDGDPKKFSPGFKRANPAAVHAAEVGRRALFPAQAGSASDSSGDERARKRARVEAGGAGSGAGSDPTILAVAAAPAGSAGGVSLPTTVADGISAAVAGGSNPTIPVVSREWSADTDRGSRADNGSRAGSTSGSDVEHGPNWKGKEKEVLVDAVQAASSASRLKRSAGVAGFPVDERLAARTRIEAQVGLNGAAAAASAAGLPSVGVSAPAPAAIPAQASGAAREKYAKSDIRHFCEKRTRAASLPQPGVTDTYTKGDIRHYIGPKVVIDLTKTPGPAAAAASRAPEVVSPPAVLGHGAISPISMQVDGKFGPPPIVAPTMPTHVAAGAAAAAAPMPLPAPQNELAVGALPAAALAGAVTARRMPLSPHVGASAGMFRPQAVSPAKSAAERENDRPAGMLDELSQSQPPAASR